MRPCICEARVQCSSGTLTSFPPNPHTRLVHHGWGQRCLKVPGQQPFSPEQWMLSLRQFRGGVPLWELERGDFSPLRAIVHITKRSFYLWLGSLAFAKEMHNFSPHMHPLPRVLTQATPAQPSKKPLPGCPQSVQREIPPQVNMCYPLSFPYPYKEKARQYRSLHFHVCIQGHFPNKSIEQYEYTIFMSQRILELKYIEGNKNNEAWKRWQFRR